MSHRAAPAAARSIAGFSAALAAVSAAAPAASAVVPLTGGFLGGSPSAEQISLRTTGSFYGTIDRFVTVLRFLDTSGPGLRGRAAASMSEIVGEGFAGQGSSTAFPLGADTTLSFVFETLGNNGAPGGRVGWFRLDVVFSPGGGPNNEDLTGAAFKDGAIGMVGDRVQVNSLDAAPAEEVPLPATLPLAGLGVLALGAAGLRRRRRG